MSTSLCPLLIFDGCCEEAIKFYRDRLGACLEHIMRYSDSPDPALPDLVASGLEHKIMHATLRFGHTRLMASDGCGEACSFQGFRLAYSVATSAEAEQAFQALAEGGNVTMPLSRTFWSPSFGVVTDKFGISWSVMVSDHQDSRADEPDRADRGNAGSRSHAERNQQDRQDDA